MDCELRNNRWRRALALTIALLVVPVASAGAGGTAATAVPSVAEAHAEVLRSEQRLTDVTAARDAAVAHLAELTHTSAQLVQQIADARSDLRARATSAYINGTPDETLLVLFGGDDLYDASARVRLMAHAADESGAAVREYRRLKHGVDPTIVDLSTELQQLEQQVRDANDAVLAARANEAEAERQEARRIAAEAMARAALAAARAATTVAPTTTAVAVVAADGAAPAAADPAAPAPTPAAPPAPPAPSAPLPAVPAGGPSEAQWAALRKCESGGNYRAVSPSGKYRGAYQFDYRTWAGLGGSGDPAAAPPAEQDARAKLLYSQRGWRPWPVCGRFLT